jgi:hypothetical protein
MITLHCSGIEIEIIFRRQQQASEEGCYEPRTVSSYNKVVLLLQHVSHLILLPSNL